MTPSDTLILTNTRVVTQTDVLDTGTVVVRDGRIVEVDDRVSTAPGGLDLGGDYLLPGLVEMHTDHMERHFMPRPKVLWPSPLAAVAAHDAQIAAAGITTVFDAISCGQYSDGSMRRQMLADQIAAVKHARAEGLLRCDHWLHLRCEVADPCVVEIFEPYRQDPLVRVVSLMDHTPGQRQWSDVSKLRQFTSDKGLSGDEFDARIRKSLGDQARYAHTHRLQVLEMLRDRPDIVLATHDDTTETHVDEALSEGATIAEFPTTFAAAAKAHGAGMKTILGAPNVVRGGSHSGNVSAIDLVRAGVLDGLSSDYVPMSLVHAAFVLPEITDLTLPASVALVSANVADMVGLDDRGRIAPDQRADLVRVAVADGVPLPRDVWRGGRRVC
ncbi:alpha-D-ribose 1-methylphosphonate 5-triphosphate diphosphatase [Roseospira marina]|uniref:Alpha-D-ribose 1-methylphosphonate 5-triphosphate diphosphatase n=1 Tax=Roseospira marina TaxID=140057 RepID=A0A5M6I8Z6_9PROT|nr:alpha-D-ribose 1-methylphosphonate 5-triphosphate diphosphatase [Roseospira marina]KAA5604661.1 alpha-D-ribose 1-methylphosphonate 5-triphosphate diphosphatase [Roseospira marina]MBB4315106.1 alpha-D-ribose 1-methylphosphonate 5-triphosphate diphosphatase [Roseospira marina]MBB5088124.1 alpha-D-ribose 1-methylphosphonate 5-triphosphate diphosphatase [Roseospira marina]